MEIKLSEKIQELIKQELHGCFEISGVVLTCSDTANMVIIADDKVRFMVTPERDELMDPKKPCFQVNMRKTCKRLGWTPRY